MKLLGTILCLSICSLCFSQAFEGVRAAEDYDQSSLFDSSMKFLLDRTELGAISNQNKPTEFTVRRSFEMRRNLVGKAGHTTGKVEFDLTMQFKDGKYRYFLSNVYHSKFGRNRFGRFEEDRGSRKTFDSDNFKRSGKTYQNIETTINTYLRNIFDELDDFLKKRQDIDEQLEW